MFSITDGKPDFTCSGRSRRSFLRVGGLGVAGGVGLPWLLRQQAAAAAAGSYLRKKSVVFLFLQGGPSHIETFDPKMTAPQEIRSIFGETATKHAGITFGAHFEKLGRLADRLSVVRSYQSRNSGHSYQKVASGGNETGATMGAVYSRIAGTNHPVTGMPLNTLVLPEAIDPEIKLGSNFETSALPTLTTPGDLGDSFAAFNPQGGGTLKRNMELRIEKNRFGDRRALLAQLDRIKRSVDGNGTLEGIDEYQRQAFDVITGGVADAFDLSKEDPKTVAKYDTSGLFPLREVTRWNDMRRASNLLGKQLLMARRLCEAGCGFVTVSDCGWDMHSNNNSPKHLGAMKMLGPQVDHAVAAFIEDCEERGLTDDILLIVTGEMGRTPRINKNGGRDHYGNLTPLLFSGGGLKMGEVVGRSDAHVTNPATTPYGPDNLFATVIHTLFDIGELRLVQSVPQDLQRAIANTEPIVDLV